MIDLIDDALEEYLTEDPGAPVVMVICTGDVCWTVLGAYRWSAARGGRISARAGTRGLGPAHVVVLNRLARNRLHPAAHTVVAPLESYVEALGGRLQVVAELDDMSIALR